MKNTLRLFVAAPLPDSLIAELESYLPPYRQPGVRVVPAENWHLTLHFIGNVDKGRLESISEIVRDMAIRSEPFNLKLLRVAPGPNKNNPRLIWAQFAENKTFEKLARALTLALGEKVKDQHPIPHVTLARFAKDLRPPKMPPTPARQNTSLEVTEIALWLSELRQPHPRYTILERYRLHAAEASAPETVPETL